MGKLGRLGVEDRKMVFNSVVRDDLIYTSSTTEQPISWSTNPFLTTLVLFPNT